VGNENEYEIRRGARSTARECFEMGRPVGGNGASEEPVCGARFDKNGTVGGVCFA